MESGIRDRLADTWVVLGAGASLNQQDVDYLKGKCPVIACNNAVWLAKWADVLVGVDPAWWDYYHADVEEKLAFYGEKFCVKDTPHAVMWKPDGFGNGWNSGLYGMHLARNRGAKRIILLGFDMHDNGGTHFFGDHPEPLKNPKAHIFVRHISQFATWPSDTEVINCTPHSALTRFGYQPLREIL